MSKIEVVALEPCVFCDLQSCAVHSVYRIEPDERKTPKVPAKVGCCEEIATAIALGAIKVSMSTGRLFLRYCGKVLTLNHCCFCGSRV